MASPLKINMELRSSKPKLTVRNLTRKLAPTPLQMQTLRERYYDFDATSSNFFKCKRDDQFFAIKIVSILYEEDQENNVVPYRIIREISILKELDHINIVRLIDVMSDGHDVFLVFEYLDNNFQAGFLKNPKMFMYPQMTKVIEAFVNYFE